MRISDWSSDVCSSDLHAKPHGNTAHEMFYQTGPFAILPMNGPDGSGTRSAIVWTVARDLAPAVTALPARALAAEIEKRMGGLLGEVRMAAPAWGYPLGFPQDRKSAVSGKGVSERGNL